MATIKIPTMSGKKTYLGIIAMAAIAMLVNWTTGEGDTITWQTGWVKVAMTVSQMLTGVGVVHMAKKALPGN